MRLDVLQEFADVQRTVQLAGLLQNTALRVTTLGWTVHNAALAEFRRRRRALGIPCACGGKIYQPAHGGPRAKRCDRCKRAARAARDKGRKR